MILSKKNNFIFFKNMKVAGSSFEIYLSKFCGDEDVITPLNEKEELIRKKLYTRNKQNYEKNFFEKYINYNFFKFTVKKIPLSKNIFKYKTDPRLETRKYYHHMTADHLYSIIGNDINKYYKIAILREPVSMFVSMYNHRAKQYDYEFMNIDQFTTKYADEFFNNQLKIVSLKNKLIIDYFLIFEDLPKSFQNLKKKLNINIIYDEFKNVIVKKIKDPKKLTVQDISEKERQNIMISAKNYNKVYVEALKKIENE